MSGWTFSDYCLAFTGVCGAAAVILSFIAGRIERATLNDGDYYEEEAKRPVD